MMMNMRIVSLGYKQKIKGITHRNHRGDDTLIHHIWTNCPQRYIAALNIENLASDHNPIYVCINHTYVKENMLLKRARNFKDYTPTKLVR